MNLKIFCEGTFAMILSLSFSLSNARARSLKNTRMGESMCACDYVYFSDVCVRAFS